MKTLTKSALKSAIRKIVLDAMSNVIKTAHANGYEIADSCWNSYTADDLEEYETFDQIIAKDGEVMFRQENLDDFQSIVTSIYDNDLTIVSKSDIEKHAKQYAEARAVYLEAQAAKKNSIAAKIARLRKQLAKLKAEETIA